MKHKKVDSHRYILVPVLLAVCLLYAGIANSLTLSRFSEADRLPSTTVKVFYQDHTGYLWMGTTNGLSRWDGYRLVSFASDPAHRDFLGSNDIITLAEDESDRLYIGTTKGLYCLGADRKTMTPATASPLDRTEIRAIVPDKDGSLWIGTVQEVVRTDSTMKVVKPQKSLPGGAVNTMMRDSRGRLWVSFWRGGLFLLDEDRGMFEKMPEVGQYDNPVRIIELDNGSILASTWENGLYIVEKRLGGSWNVNSVPVDDADRRTLQCVYGMASDSRGRIWMLGDRGIAVVSLSGDIVEVEDVPEIEGQMNNVFSNVLVTKGGNIWVSTFSGGVWKISYESDIVKDIDLCRSDGKMKEIKPFVNRMYVSSDHTVWFNQNRWGLAQYEPESGNTRLYTEIDGISGLEGLSTIGCILPGRRDGEITVVPRYAHVVYRMIRSGNDVKVSEKIEMIDPESRNITGGCTTSDGYVWLCGSSGLEIITPSGGIHNLFRELHDGASMRAGRNGDVWVATLSKGLMRVMTDRPDATHLRIAMRRVGGTGGMSIRGLDFDPQTGGVWFVTNFGELWHVDRDGRLSGSPILVIPPQKAGTPVSVTVDRGGAVWIAAHRGVMRYSPRTGSLADYDDLLNPDGLEALVESSVFMDPTSGLLYLGGSGGISVIDTEQNPSFKAGLPMLTDVSVDGLSLHNDDEIGSMDIAAGKITLSPNARNIRFFFSTLDPGNTAAIRYQFRLKGLDKDWQEAGDFGNSAFFNRLPNGNFTLELRACGPDGVWTEIPVSYNVEKLPWWYQTWWAILIYFLSALTAGYFILRAWWRHKKVREQLRITELERKNTEDLARLKLQYVANVSHDFLTPVSIIGCITDEIERGYKAKSHQLESIRENLRKIRRLVEAVLDIRSLDRNELRLQPKCGDLASFVESVCIGHFSAVMESKQIEFSVRLPEENHIIWFDPDKIEKIVFNLVGNAYKYTEPGGSITVGIEYRGEIDGVESSGKDNQAEAVITVSDTGKGIPEENLRHIFERFYGDPNAGFHMSHGLGLAIVKEFTELHGGRVMVESELGQGSRFTVILPVDTSRKPAETGPESGRINTTVRSDSTKRHKLLLVEDNGELLHVISRMLGDTYEVFIATDGEAALEIVERDEPDIIVSDVMMPRLDGLEMTRRLKGNLSTSHIPVILLTAKNSPEDRVECYMAGADGYISKPFETKVLEARIESMLVNRSKDRETLKRQPESNPVEVVTSELDKEFMRKMVNFIKENLASQDMDIDQLAVEMSLSRSTFYRKVKTLTGLSPKEFVKNIKLKHGYELLRTTDMSVADVAYASGFTNAKYFSMCFKTEFGVSPRQRRNSTSVLHMDNDEKGK